MPIQFTATTRSQRAIPWAVLCAPELPDARVPRGSTKPSPEARPAARAAGIPVARALYGPSAAPVAPQAMKLAHSPTRRLPRADDSVPPHLSWDARCDRLTAPRSVMARSESELGSRQLAPLVPTPATARRIRLHQDDRGANRTISLRPPSPGRTLRRESGLHSWPRRSPRQGRDPAADIANPRRRVANRAGVLPDGSRASSTSARRASPARKPRWPVPQNAPRDRPGRAQSSRRAAQPQHTPRRPVDRPHRALRSGRDPAS